MKTFLAHQLTVLRHTKCKKNHVISSKNGEVIQLLVVIFGLGGGGLPVPVTFGSLNEIA